MNLNVLRFPRELQSVQRCTDTPSLNGVEVHCSRPRPRQALKPERLNRRTPPSSGPNQKPGSMSELPSPSPTHPSTHKSCSGTPYSSLCSSCTLRDRRAYGKGSGLWSSTAWCKSWLDLVALWPRASLLTALGLSFHISEVGIIIALSTEGYGG